VRNANLGTTPTHIYLGTHIIEKNLKIYNLVTSSNINQCVYLLIFQTYICVPKNN
jgi:hypothetical protein